jgi:hypothetical protein
LNGPKLRSTKFLIAYLNFSFYKLQDKGHTFDNLESITRRINPNIFTWSQHSFKNLIEKENMNKNNIEEIANLATLNNVGQNYRVSGVVGLYLILIIFTRNT